MTLNHTGLLGKKKNLQGKKAREKGKETWIVKIDFFYKFDREN